MRLGVWPESQGCLGMIFERPFCTSAAHRHLAHLIYAEVAVKKTQRNLEKCSRDSKRRTK